MTEQLIPKHRKRKRQPTAECMREQLRLAAEEIIALRAQLISLRSAFHAPFESQRRLDVLMRRTIGEIPQARQPWWHRLLKRRAA